MSILFAFSINTGLEWILLPPPTELTKKLGVYTKGRFIGDPTADSETEITANERDEIEEGEQWVKEFSFCVQAFVHSVSPC